MRRNMWIETVVEEKDTESFGEKKIGRIESWREIVEEENAVLWEGKEENCGKE